MAQAPTQAFEAWLGDAGRSSALLGGKGASLDRLAGLGFPVPAGGCWYLLQARPITTEAPPAPTEMRA